MSFVIPLTVWALIAFNRHVRVDTAYLAGQNELVQSLVPDKPIYGPSLHHGHCISYAGVVLYLLGVYLMWCMLCRAQRAIGWRRHNCKRRFIFVLQWSVLMFSKVVSHGDMVNVTLNLMRYVSHSCRTWLNLATFLGNTSLGIATSDAFPPLRYV